MDSSYLSAQGLLVDEKDFCGFASKPPRGGFQGCLFAQGLGITNTGLFSHSLVEEVDV